MKRVFKAPFITRTAPVDARCCFFDAVAAIVVGTGLDAAATGATIAAGVGLDAGVAGIVGPTLAGATLGAIGGGIAGNPLEGVEIGAGVGALGGGLAEAGAFGGGAVGGAAPDVAGTAGGAASGAAPAVAPASLSTGGASAAGGAGLAGADPGALAATAGATDPTLGFGAGIGTAGQDVSGAAGALGPGSAPLSITAPSDLSFGGGAGGAAAPSTSALVGGAAQPTPSFLDTLEGAIPSSKTLQTGLSGAGLLYNIMGGQQQPTASKNEANLANSLYGQSQQLQSYLQKGTLPPGVQNQISLAEKNAEATVRSRYASMGQSGSSAEAQDIANAKLTAANEGTQIALQLLQQGVSEANLSGELFNQILSYGTQQDQIVGGAIQNFANAVGGAGGNNNYKLVPTGA